MIDLYNSKIFKSLFFDKFLDKIKSKNSILVDEILSQEISFLITFTAQELKRGNLTNTVSALKLALNIDPKNSDAYIGFGRAYFKDGRISPGSRADGEEAIYRKLGLQYIPPELREDSHGNSS